MTGRQGTVAERFWPKVSVADVDECWHWTGSRNALGYGSFRGADGRTTKAHRVAWLLANPGEVLSMRDSICHTCDVPSCVNPQHLYRGDQKTNMADAVRRGRHRPPPPGSAPSGDDHWSRRMPNRIHSGLMVANPHGTTNKYAQGCKCDECRAANAAYKRERRRAI